MSDPRIERIHEFWNGQARAHATGLAATTPDPLLKEIELAALARALDPDADTFEMGCGNGYNLLALAGGHLGGRLVGVDYASEMIAAAGRARAGHPARDRVAFAVGDALGDLAPFGTFGQVFTDRCLINLPEMGLQLQAVANLERIIRPGGRLVLLECSRQAQERLNGLRARVGLDPIPYHWHNLYLDEPPFLAGVPASLELVATDAFSSLYYLISRVFNARLTPPGRAPDYTAEINRIATRLPSVGDVGPHKIWAFRKRV